MTTGRDSSNPPDLVVTGAADPRPEPGAVSPLAASLMADTSDAVLLLDADLRVLGANAAFHRCTGHPLEVVAGQTLHVLGGGCQDDAWLRTVTRAVATDGVWRGPLWIRRASGEASQVVLSLTRLRPAQAAVAHLLLLCPPEVARASLGRDPLTGLPGARALREGLRAALDQPDVRSALLLVSLNRFREVNTRLGWRRADAALHALAGRLAECAAPHGLATRLGGDRFGVLVPADDAAAVEETADAMLRALARPLTIDAHTLTLTANIGLALAPDDASDADALFERAAAALDEARGDGRGVWRRCGQRGAPTGRFWLDVQRALERDEFELWYQPLVHLRSGRIRGVEALLRWQHPARGPLPPSHFLPLLTRSGLMNPLADRVLDEAIAQVARWRSARAPELSLAVNLSLDQLLDDALLPRLEAGLAAHRLPPSALTLELGAHATLRHRHRLTPTLRALRALGVHLTLDAFGQTPFTLTDLIDLPIGGLKLDAEVILNLDRDPGAQSLVEATVALTHSLGLKAGAVGVERATQLDRLRASGCDEAQGHFFGRPMPPPQLEVLLR